MKILLVYSSLHPLKEWGLRQTRGGSAGQKIQEHDITFEWLENGDGKFSVNVQIDGKRLHRRLGRESEGVTREQCER